MPTFRQDIHAVLAATKPHVGPLAGGKLAKRSRALAAMKAQDKPVALGRRVVAAQSLAGESDWLTIDAAPIPAVLVQSHPLTDVERTTLRGVATVTPGHILQGSILHLASGSTQTAGPGAEFSPGVKGGTFGLTIDWTAEDATTATTNRTADLPPSAHPDGAAPASPWSAIRLAKIKDIRPPGFEANTARWSQHTGAEIELYHVGGARVIDSCLYESPAAIARADTDAADQAVSHLLGAPTPDSAGPTISHPVEELASDDPRGGTLRTLEVPQAQRERLGPHLLSWTSYNEGSGDVGDTEPVPVVGTSAGFRRLWDQASVAYDADEMGLSFSAGAYARDYDQNHPYAMAAVGTTPVIVAVYGGGSDGSTAGTVRIQANAWSWVDVTIPADGVPAWRYGYGHLRVGKGPGDTSIVQAFIRRDAGTGDVGVSALSIFHAGRHAPNL